MKTFESIKQPFSRLIQYF